jgi:hypothetical protein
MDMTNTRPAPTLEQMTVRRLSELTDRYLSGALQNRLVGTAADMSVVELFDLYTYVTTLRVSLEPYSYDHELLDINAATLDRLLAEQIRNRLAAD